MTPIGVKTTLGSPDELILAHIREGEICSWCGEPSSRSNLKKTMRAAMKSLAEIGHCVASVTRGLPLQVVLKALRLHRLHHCFMFISFVFAAPIPEYGLHLHADLLDISQSYRIISSSSGAWLYLGRRQSYIIISVNKMRRLGQNKSGGWECGSGGGNICRIWLSHCYVRLVGHVSCTVDLSIKACMAPLVGSKGWGIQWVADHFVRTLEQMGALLSFPQRNGKIKWWIWFHLVVHTFLPCCIELTLYQPAW
jgi:hypothetical protein